MQGPTTALSLAIAQGCCRSVEKIELGAGSRGRPPVNQTQLNILAGALQVDGALPALKTLRLRFFDTPSVLSKLAEALAGGALPLLEHFKVLQEKVTDDHLNRMSDMVEGQAQIPGCRKLKTFDACDLKIIGSWIKSTSPVKMRLLRALLPSLEELPELKWSDSVDTCFRDVRVPFLQNLHVNIRETYPSLEVLEAAPALKKIEYGSGPHHPVGPAAFQPVVAALHRGVGPRNQQKIILSWCDFGDAHFSAFVQALEGSACAERMERIWFNNCRIGVEGAQALGNLLRRDRPSCVGGVVAGW